jgi:hypothetical protein
MRVHSLCVTILQCVEGKICARHISRFELSRVVPCASLRDGLPLHPALQYQPVRQQLTLSTHHVEDTGQDVNHEEYGE